MITDFCKAAGTNYTCLALKFPAFNIFYFNISFTGYDLSCRILNSLLEAVLDSVKTVQY